MYRDTDTIVAMSLRDLRISVLHRCPIYFGSGISFRSKQVEGGYRVTLRKGTKVTGVNFTVRTSTMDMADGRTTIVLLCASCGKKTNKHLFLDWDSLGAMCAKCLGLPYGQFKNPKGRPIDYDDAARFRRLMRRKVMLDGLAFVIEAMRTLTPEEFFAARPYLVPERLHFIRKTDPDLYVRLLAELHRKYGYSLSRLKRPKLAKRDEKWLEGQTWDRMLRGDLISTKEREWLQKKLDDLTERKPSLGIPTKSSSPPPPGNQPGTASVQWSSPLTATDSSSSKTNSNQGTNVKSAMELVSELVKAARATGRTGVMTLTNTRSENSSAQPAKEEER